MIMQIKGNPPLLLLGCLDQAIIQLADLFLRLQPGAPERAIKGDIGRYQECYQET